MPCNSLKKRNRFTFEANETFVYRCIYVSVTRAIGWFYENLVFVEKEKST